MGDQTDQQKVDCLQEFLVNPDRKYLFYDRPWDMMFLDLPDGYRLDDDGSIWIEEDGEFIDRTFKSSSLVLLCKKT